MAGAPFDAEARALGLPRSFADVLESCEANLSEPVYGQLLQGLRSLRAQVDESKLFGEIGADAPPAQAFTSQDLEDALVGDRDLRDLVDSVLTMRRSKALQLVAEIVRDKVGRLQAALAAERPPSDGFEQNLFAVVREELLPLALIRRPSLTREDFQASLEGWRSRGKGAVLFDPILVRAAVEALAEEHPDWSRGALEEQLAGLLKTSPRTVHALSRFSNNP